MTIKTRSHGVRLTFSLLLMIWAQKTPWSVRVLSVYTNVLSPQTLLVFLGIKFHRITFCDKVDVCFCQILNHLLRLVAGFLGKREGQADLIRVGEFQGLLSKGQTGYGIW